MAGIRKEKGLPTVYGEQIHLDEGMRSDFDIKHARYTYWLCKSNDPLPWEDRAFPTMIPSSYLLCGACAAAAVPDFFTRYQTVDPKMTLPSLFSPPFSSDVYFDYGYHQDLLVTGARLRAPAPIAYICSPWNHLRFKPETYPYSWRALDHGFCEPVEIIFPRPDRYYDLGEEDLYAVFPQLPPSDCFALFQKPTSFDGRGYVPLGDPRLLLNFPIYNIDWGDPVIMERGTMEDWLELNGQCRALQTMVECVRTRLGQPKGASITSTPAPFVVGQGFQDLLAASPTSSTNSISDGNDIFEEDRPPLGFDVQSVLSEVPSHGDVKGLPSTNDDDNIEKDIDVDRTNIYYAFDRTLNGSCNFDEVHSAIQGKEILPYPSKSSARGDTRFSDLPRNPSKAAPEQITNSLSSLSLVDEDALRTLPERPRMASLDVKLHPVTTANLKVHEEIMESEVGRASLTDGAANIYQRVLSKINFSAGEDEVDKRDPSPIVVNDTQTQIVHAGTTSGEALDLPPAYKEIFHENNSNVGTEMNHNKAHPMPSKLEGSEQLVSLPQTLSSQLAFEYRAFLDPVPQPEEPPNDIASEILENQSISSTAVENCSDTTKEIPIKPQRKATKRERRNRHHGRNEVDSFPTGTASASRINPTSTESAEIGDAKDEDRSRRLLAAAAQLSTSLPVPTQFDVVEEFDGNLSLGIPSSFRGGTWDFSEVGEEGEQGREIGPLEQEVLDWKRERETSAVETFQEAEALLMGLLRGGQGGWE